MKKNGFTLIELLITMGIIAVLSGMAVFNFSQARSRARDVQRKSDMSQLKKALELYRNDNNGLYPASLTEADQLTFLVTPGYAKAVFKDPKGVDWHTYLYTYDSENKSYTIDACLENTADSTKLTPVEQCASNKGVIYRVQN